jgi:predicted transposase YbfD/YdcC
MNKKQIEIIMEQAIIRFLEDDSYLLSVEVNERSLTHKFAEHLQAIIGCPWNVDCEYNRFGNQGREKYLAAGFQKKIVLLYL